MLLSVDGISIDILNIEGKTPLYDAISTINIDMVNTLLVRGANINVQDYEESTPLHFAAKFGTKEMVELLLRNDLTTINEVDMDEKTPLYYAISSNNFEMVNILIENGSNINIQDLNGNTPLHLATSITENDTEIIRIIELLLSEDNLYKRQRRAGDVANVPEANKFITNIQGELPLDIAQNTHGPNNAIARILFDDMSGFTEPSSPPRPDDNQAGGRIKRKTKKKTKRSKRSKRSKKRSR